MIYKFDSSEAIFAKNFLNNTNKHIFLTGRAGTGKTTLLKELIKTTHKAAVIAAPTGIAAINAGGTTLHSLFQLPFGAFLPSNQVSLSDKINIQINTPQSLIKKIKMNATKRRLLNSIELLVIDEASMLRADLLDAIDYVLRYVRRKRNTPFGGVQILFIGDLWQLPPIVKDEEMNFLQPFYKNFYFFNAHALSDNMPIYIELKHVFRQKDNNFISLLNNFRNNKITTNDLQILNECYVANIDKEKYDGYIFLTTHNYKADSLNINSLNQLAGESKIYSAIIEDDFGENIYPIDNELELKKDAQVMFVKNDYSGNKAYFNGKIGKIKDLQDNYILVSFNDGSPDVFVEKYVWENKRFKLNNETNEIEEKIIGRFIQYPLRLAWAITIHKSQGLTFEKAIVDISSVFAAGQAYVALSRLTSLSGLVLSKRVSNTMPDIDIAINKFSETEKDSSALSHELKDATIDYAKKQTIKAFDFYDIENYLTEHIESYNKKKNMSAKQRQKEWAEQLKKQFDELNIIAQRFRNQLFELSRNNNIEVLSNIKERIVAAKDYFEPKLQELSKQILNHTAKMQAEKGVKKYTAELKSLDAVFYQQIISIKKAEVIIDSTITNGVFDNDKLTEIKQNTDRAEADESIVKESKIKKNSAYVSYEMFLEAKDIEQIANERELSVSTIEGHLSKYVANGKISVYEFVEEDKVEMIVEAINEFNDLKLSPIKEYLGNDVSYSEIRFVINHFKHKHEIKNG